MPYYSFTFDCTPPASPMLDNDKTFFVLLQVYVKAGETRIT